MSNGIITCKCGHEVADVPEPHPMWKCPVCQRMGAFEWIPNAPLERELEDQMSKPSQGAMKAAERIEAVYQSWRDEGYINKEASNLDIPDFAAIIDEETGVAELLEALRRVNQTLVCHGHIDKNTELHLFVDAAIAKAEVKP